MNTEIEEAKAMLHKIYHRFVINAAETNIIATGLERGLALVAAAEPFARFYAEAISPERGHGGRDTDVFYKLNDVSITLGDLRRLTEALGK